ncbi:unnamed protein product [Lota lota]
MTRVTAALLFFTASRADVAERKAFIETMHNKIKKLEDEIAVKQNTVKQIKDNAKSMKANNRLLQHYEMTLKGELEKKQENYNHDNVSAQLTEVEPVAQRDHQAEVDGGFSKGIASLHLNPTEEDPAGSLAREEEMEEMMEEEEEEEQPLLVAEEEDDDVDDDNDRRDTALPHSFLPPKINPLSPPGRMKLVPSTPTFSINSSPSISPGRGSSHHKSPTFLFSTTSDPSTPSFPGFGFDMGSAQEENTIIMSRCSRYCCLNHERVAAGPGFLFDETERPEGEFHFSFSKSPGGSGSSQDKAAEDAFPFSFNYS